MDLRVVLQRVKVLSWAGGAFRKIGKTKRDRDWESGGHRKDPNRLDSRLFQAKVVWKPYYFYCSLLFFISLCQLCVLVVSPEAFPLIVVSGSTLKVLGAFYGLTCALCIYSIIKAPFGIRGAWLFVLRFLLLSVYGALFYIMKNGSLIYHLLYLQYLLSLFLFFTFPNVFFFSCLAVILISLKCLYYQLPIESHIYLSLMIVIVLSKYSTESYIRLLSEQEKAVKQARIAASELANANIRLQQSALFSETTAQMKEKRRLAEALHDNIGHILTTLLVNVLNHRYRDEASTESIRKHDDEVESIVKKAIKDFRIQVSALREEAEVEMSWGLRWRSICRIFSDCTGVRVTLDVPETLDAVSDQIGETIMKVIKEALNNSVRHGNASAIAITIAHDAGVGLLMLKVSDNGCGARSIIPGFGIKSMEERVRGLHGKMAWATKPGRGFDLGIDLPLGSIHR